MNFNNMTKEQFHSNIAFEKRSKMKETEEWKRSILRNFEEANFPNCYGEFGSNEDCNHNCTYKDQCYMRIPEEKIKEANN